MTLGSYRVPSNPMYTDKGFLCRREQMSLTHVHVLWIHCVLIYAY